MQKIQDIARKYLTSVLLLMLAGGFLMLLAELLLTNHVDGIQIVAVIASAVGLAAVLVGWFAKGTLRVTMAVVLILLSVTGVIGTAQHLEEGGERGEAGRPALLAAGENQQIAYSAQEEEGESEGPRGEGGESAPPPLAPLSLAGLSLMGAVVLLARKDGVVA